MLVASCLFRRSLVRVLTLPDLVGKLSAPQLPGENSGEGQQNEDEEKRAHDGADDDAGPS